MLTRYGVAENGVQVEKGSFPEDIGNQGSVITWVHISAMQPLLRCFVHLQLL